MFTKDWITDSHRLVFHTDWITDIHRLVFRTDWIKDIHRLVFRTNWIPVLILAQSCAMSFSLTGKLTEHLVPWTWTNASQVHLVLAMHRRENNPLEMD